MRALPSQDVGVVSFYHYGLMRLESLEWIGKRWRRPRTVTDEQRKERGDGGAIGTTRSRIVDLGVRPLINANGTLTSIGGSRMPSVVLDAMREAAVSFVDMFELQEAVSARIAG